MNITEKHIEMFDRYINGELNKEWSMAFERKLAGNPALNEAFEKHRLAVQALQEAGRKSLKKELIASTAVVATAGLSTYRPKSTRLIRKIFGLVTVGAIAAGGIYYYLSQTSGHTEKSQAPEVQEEVEEVLESTVPEPKKEPAKHSVKVERQQIHDTIVVYEYDTVFVEMDSEEAKNIGTIIETETIVNYLIDTIEISQ